MSTLLDGAVEIVVRDEEFCYRCILPRYTIERGPLFPGSAEFVALAQAFASKKGDIGEAYQRWLKEKA